MSELILPGDPPASAFKRQIAMLQQEVAARRQQLSQLTTILIEIITQHGVDNAITIGPPTLQGKTFQMRIKPTENAGATVEVVMEDKPQVYEGNGEVA